MLQNLQFETFNSSYNIMLQEKRLTYTTVTVHTNGWGSRQYVSLQSKGLADDK